MIPTFSFIEPLESRIAPAALTIVNPLPDIVAGSGKTGATVELSEMFDATVAHPNHTLVTFTVNLDSDPNTPGIQPSTFVMELFDDEAPLTVQNFLSYVQSPNALRDFVGTFFHRSIPGFVVQGGGFNDTNLAQHITTGPAVHNEFDPTRSNTIGTVAMAKTNRGPDTATSEWFVNLADNSSNLDNQNGGFTVFGQIISGLDVFNKIAALPTISVNAGLTDVPVQNYNSDPDHNPNTPAPKPNANQLITITGVHVDPPATGDATGDVFSVGAITGTPGLVTAKIVGTQLKLAYASGKSGEADVTVHVVNGADSIDETIHVEVQPNLIANVVTDSLPKIIAPGDVGTAVVKLTNNGAGQYTTTVAGKASTQVDIKFYLSFSPDPNNPNTVVDSDDILVGSLLNQPLNLAGGASATFSVPLKVQQQLAATDGAQYILIAQVTPSTGAAPTTELFTDDNTAVDGGVHALVNKVGTVTVLGVGTRVIPSLSFTDSDGDRVVVRLTGNGTVDVIPDGSEFDLSVTNTNVLSSLVLRTQAPLDPTNTTHTGRIELHNTDIAGAIGTVNFATADIDGYTTLSGGALALNIGSLSGNRTMIIGSLLPTTTAPIALTFGQVSDYSIESDQPIGTLTAVNWLDTMGSDDHIIAPSINKLNITGLAATATQGDFDANVTLEGKAKMSLFRVAGFYENATFIGLQTQSVDVVKVGGMQDASFLLGTTSVPTPQTAFAKVSSIGSFTVTGAAATAPADAFIDSQVAAANIGAISLVRVDTASGSANFGFVADKIASYVRDGSTPLKNLNQAGSPYDLHGNYSVIVL